MSKGSLYLVTSVESDSSGVREVTGVISLSIVLAGGSLDSCLCRTSVPKHCLWFPFLHLLEHLLNAQNTFLLE